MITVQDHNAQAFLEDLDELAGIGSGSFIVELGNAMDYALYLHERAGYSVINEQEWLETVTEFLAAHLAQGRPLTERAIAASLAEATEDTVRYFQQFVGAFQPPLTEGGPPRPKHAGGLNWADRTTRLASAYFSVVTTPSGAVRRAFYDYQGVAYA